jgi:hypothetical protein
VAIALVVDAGLAGDAAAAPGPTASIAAETGEAVIISGLVFSTSASLAITGITDNAGGNTWVFSTANAQSPPSQQYHAPSSGGYVVVFVGWCLSLVNDITSVSISDSSGDTDFWRVSVSSWTGIVAVDSGAGRVQSSTASPSETVSLFNSGDLVIGVSNDDTQSYTGTPAGFVSFVGAGSVPNIGAVTPDVTGSYTATWTLASADIAGTVLQAFSPVLVTRTVSLTTPNIALAAPLVTPGQGQVTISLTTPNLALAAPALTVEAVSSYAVSWLAGVPGTAWAAGVPIPSGGSSGG